MVTLRVSYGFELNFVVIYISEWGAKMYVYIHITMVRLKHGQLVVSAGYIKAWAKPIICLNITRYIVPFGNP